MFYYQVLLVSCITLNFLIEKQRKYSYGFRTGRETRRGMNLFLRRAWEKFCCRGNYYRKSVSYEESKMFCKTTIRQLKIFASLHFKSSHFSAHHMAVSARSPADILGSFLITSPKMLAEVFWTQHITNKIGRTYKVRHLFSL